MAGGESQDVKWKEANFDRMDEHYRRFCRHQWGFSGVFALLVLLNLFWAVQSIMAGQKFWAFIQCALAGFMATQVYRTWMKWHRLRRMRQLLEFIRKAHQAFRSTQSSTARQHWLDQIEAAIADYNKVVWDAGLYHELKIEFRRVEEEDRWKDSSQ